MTGEPGNQGAWAGFTSTAIMPGCQDLTRRINPDARDMMRGQAEDRTRDMTGDRGTGEILQPPKAN
jgi:hypothetical protein